MDWLERELKNALGREDPPADFAARVIREAGLKAGRRPVYHWPRWLAAAAVVVLVAGAGLGYRQYRGEVAKERVMLAFRIASVQVNRIQTHVREVAR
jgi:hypothetical protein